MCIRDSFGDEAVITLTNIPSGANYDVFLYKAEEGCSNELASSQNGSNSSEELRWPERYATDDSGVFIIGVKQVGNSSYHCGHEYVLSIDLEI